MAIGRLKMKVGGGGKAGPHAAYIFREGRYARDDTLERLDAVGVGNLPAWARDDPIAFWRAADAHERANGTTYREMEIALPRELAVAERTALVEAFVAQEIGNAHAYQWAIHTPVSSSDGGEQPHVHLMFSERQVDGIERGPDLYFKRANSKAPERGGAKKGYGPQAGERLSAERRAEHLKALRGRWETMANAHLERAGHAARIDMRSYADRGIKVETPSRLLPSEWRDSQKREDVIGLRRAIGEVVEADAELRQAIPDRDAQIIDLEQERAKRTEAQRGGLLAAAREERVIAHTQAASAQDQPTPEVVVQRWTAEHQRQLAAVQAKARRVMGKAQGMEQRHAAVREAHQRRQPVPATGLLASLRQASYDAARSAWEKTAKALQRRAHQLAERVGRLRDYLGPVNGQQRHRGDELAARKVEREHPGLAKLYAAVMRDQRADQVKRQEQAREKIREQRAKERERDDRGRGR